MALSLSNKTNLHIVCTNFGSFEDGIGHYTSKIVEELRKNDNIEVSVYSKRTSNLSKFQLFFSFKMTKQILTVLKNVKRSKENNYVVLEYPFVEYNPFFLLSVFFLKLLKSNNTKLVVSLHEFSRTKKIRKIFIRILINFSGIVLYTRKEDISLFKEKNISFIKRVIPASIQPQKKIKEIIEKENIKVCFFGIINFETKEITNMLASWKTYRKENKKSKIDFFFISSSYNEVIKSQKKIKYCYNFLDSEVSNLLLEVDFIILPLKPSISVNNTSLSVGCIHGCIPIGSFDEKYFDPNFGINMKNYSREEFIRVFYLIESLDIETQKEKRFLAIDYGKKKSVKNSTSSYLKMISL
jgi:hypothetical protein